LERFVDKSVVVTGAGSGIGRASAMSFAAEGAQVVIADLDPAAAAKVVDEIQQAGGNATAVTVNTADKTSVQEMLASAIAAYDKLDVLHNNAGTFDHFLPFQEIEEELWDRVIDVNLKGYFLCCQAAMPELLKTGGNIVMTASVAGLGAGGGGAAYTASKFGTIGLINQIAVEVAEQGVRVNGVAPGGVKTNMTMHLLEDPVAAELIQAGTPVGRWAEPQEIADAVLYLASPQASYTTGTVLRVDGGMRSK